MNNHDLLHVGIASLAPVRVVHQLCIFPTPPNNPDGKIRRTFQSLREWLVGFGLDPEALLHIGIPTLDGRELITYDCCIEFPLPIDDEGDDISQKELPGGRYVVLRVEKKRDKISKAIRQLNDAYIPENQITVDVSRPVYEIYYKDSMEYCVPVIGERDAPRGTDIQLIKR
jgi:DNA gyrase inhibitor GyrI